MNDQTLGGQPADRTPTRCGPRSVARRQSIQDFALSRGLSPRKVLRYVSDELHALAPSCGTGTFFHVIERVGVEAWRESKRGRVSYDVIDGDKLAGHVHERQGVVLSAQDAVHIANILKGYQEFMSGGHHQGCRLCVPVTGYEGFYKPVAFQEAHMAKVEAAISSLSSS